MTGVERTRDRAVAGRDGDETPALEVDGLSHRYGRTQALTDVSVAAAPGELIALLGPSGCGKTTLVQAIAGHLHPTAGQVALHGTTVTTVPPESRGVGVVFQRSTLYPHMTVAENVAYGLAAQGVPDETRAERVRRYLELVELTHLRAASPDALSGGQARRVELARALAPEPDVLVLDEPLSALDRRLRVRLRDEITRIQRTTGVTTLFVTHDQADAMTVADRLVVMRDGTVAATGTPRALYESPPNRFTARFLGRSNELAGRVVDDDVGRALGDAASDDELDLVRVAVGETRFVVPDTAPKTDRVLVHVRPEAVRVAAAGVGDDRERTDRNGSDHDAESGGPNADRDATVSLDGTVARVADAGSRYDVHVSLDSATAIDEGLETPRAVDSPPTVTAECTRCRLAAGDRVRIAFDGRDVSVFPRSTERAESGGAGDPVR